MPNFVVFGKDTATGQFRPTQPGDTLVNADGTTFAPSAHKNTHKSGGSDAWVSGDALDGAVRALADSSGNVLTVGAVSSGLVLSNDGDNRIIGVPAAVGTPPEAEFVPDPFATTPSVATYFRVAEYLNQNDNFRYRGWILVQSGGTKFGQSQNPHADGYTGDHMTGTIAYVTHAFSNSANSVTTYVSVSRRPVFGASAHRTFSTGVSGRIQIGLMERPAASILRDQMAGCYFAGRNSGNILAVTRNNNTAGAGNEMVTDTGVPWTFGGTSVSTTIGNSGFERTFRIAAKSGECKFYVDGSLVATHITGIPHSGWRMSPTAASLTVQSGGANITYLTWIGCKLNIQEDYAF